MSGQKHTDQLVCCPNCQHRFRTDPLVRFWGKVVPLGPDECWEWQGTLAVNGYAIVQVAGKRTLAHRVSYELHKGPIPEGLVIDHLCRNHACVNPHHLEAVTQSVNVRRGISPAARYAVATHCKHGHLWTDDTPRDRNGHRRCPACATDRNAMKRARV